MEKFNTSELSFIHELKKTGSLLCNEQLARKIYNNFKKEIPTLYLQENQTFQKYQLVIFTSEMKSNLLLLLQLKRDLNEETKEISEILNHLGIVEP